MVTIQKFYRVSGESTQSRGVIPDIVLPDRQQFLETGERYLQYSLPWDTVASTDFEPWQGQLPERTRLKKLSLTRQQENQLFADISEQAQLLKERSEQTRIPLQLEASRAERERVASLKDFGFHGAEPKEKDDSDSAWLQDLNDDAVFIEGRNLLSDMIRVSAELHAGYPKAVNGY